ncbi:MAG: bifunctional adenosylcobinamide kinase/adenosylcobinamide-phosphate guanylyltransferase [Synechococcaceae cyanobacterium]|nr:bifunctional adenosylcobinamide kinase/adenosylcobinamide-phosphate guanylyltransferase [Synechococcaceae cyanobacterium]
MAVVEPDATTGAIGPVPRAGVVPVESSAAPAGLERSRLERAAAAAVERAPAGPDPGRALVCGPSGGGKSRWAEHLAACSGRSVVYLATGPLLAGDADWQQRLERHRRRRPLSWSCLEVEGELAAALADLAAGQLGLVDSLGTWVAAWLESEDRVWVERSQELLATLSRCRAALVLVGEEVGWGVIPATAAGCRFQARLTALQLQIAGQCDAHWLVVGGRALDLRRLGEAVPAEL